MADHVLIDIVACKACGQNHAGLTATASQVAGQTLYKYRCPVKDVRKSASAARVTVRGKSDGPAPAPRRPRAPKGQGSGGTASGHASAGGPGNDTIIHNDIVVEPPAPAPAPKPRRTRGGTGGDGSTRPAPSGGDVEHRTVTLDVETVRRVVASSGWDVASGFVERMRELGVGTPGQPAILAHADEVAAQARATPAAQARKDEKERQVGRDLADIMVSFLAHERTTPEDWGNMFPRALAVAWNANPAAFARPTGTGAGSGGSSGGAPPAGLNVNSILGPQGTQPGAAVATEQPAQGGTSESVPNQVADGVAVVAGGIAGAKAGAAIGGLFGPTGRAIGGALGSVAGGVVAEYGSDAAQAALFGQQTPAIAVQPASP